MTFAIRESTLLVLVFLLQCGVSFALVWGEEPSQAAGEVVSTHRPSEQTRQPASEADFQAQVQHVEQLARSLEAGLKTYRQHLQTAMQQQGYGLHHPLFRTHINGFEQDQIDLEDADDYKRGLFAFSLKNAGQPLEPDPFGDWVEVQKWLDSFEATMDDANRVVARAHILVANSTENIPRDTFQKLRKRWQAAAGQATDAYEHAMAVRAVQYIDGETVPAPETFRYIYGGGRYVVICGFVVCSPQSATNADELNKIPVRH